MAIRKRRVKYPKFSVLITVYGEEKSAYLNEALKSIENQTIKPDEIVLVEDGPLNKKLEKIVEIHRNIFINDFKVVKLVNNRGRGAASRAGIPFISNEWIARVDSDDISVANRFELQLNAIVKDPALRMIGGQVQEFLNDDIDNIVGRRRVPLANETIKDFAKYRSPINNPSIMFRKTALSRIGGYPTLNVMEDYDLCVKFIAAGFKIKNLPNILVNMRVSKKLYNRRGGIKYLFQYIDLKNKWRKLGIGNFESVILSDLSMICNVVLPSWLRKIVYQKILHHVKR